MMKERKRPINKAKGVEICADMMGIGAKRKEIVSEITGKYGVSVSAVEKWLTAARPIVESRQKEAEAIRAKEMAQGIADTAKRLNLSRERVLEEYAKIAFFDIRTIFTEDGSMKPMNELSDEAAGAIAGIETFEGKTSIKDEQDNEVESVTQGKNRKIKIVDKRGALDSICRVLGYNAAEKREIKADISLSELPIEFD